MESVHLIVGLGNPGAQYENTRHNIGFMLVAELASRWGARWKVDGKFAARLAVSQYQGRKVLLCQPQTYMNASGTAVRRIMDYYRVAEGSVVIAVDDADLPLGEIRLRLEGGTGGHHGLESVEQHLGTREYARQRLGIGRGPGLRKITGHVLGRFSEEDTGLVEAVLSRGADQIECWLLSGMQKAMNQFNGMVNPPEHKGTGQ